MMGFYVLRGQDHEKLLRLSEMEKAIYYAWMELHHEEEANKYKQLMGGK
ncbi:hypothetical protein [Paenibacillus lautus]|nr:hypothetical protein [Paenibacillus lautus]